MNCLCSISSSFDSRWTIPVAVSLVDRGDTNLDEYAPLIAHENYYGVECVEPDGKASLAGTCPNGHYYNWYPVAVPVIAAPVVFVLRKAVTLFSPLAPHSLIGPSDSVRAAFLAGDFVTSRAIVEVLIASFFVALSTIVVSLIGRLFLPDAYSVFLALIFAFGTSAWSTASRALWQHGPSMLMLSIALYLLLLADSKPWLIPCAAIPVALAYLLRPTNSLFVAAITAYVAARHRRYLLPYLLCALPLAATFLMYNESIYKRALPSYFSMRPALPTGVAPVAEAMTGVMVSPSRGLLVYTPIFLFSIGGMVWALRSRWQAPLSSFLIAVIVGHWLLLGVYSNFWWGGHSYGPRMFSDLTPLFVFFLIPVMMKWRETARRRGPAVVFLVLAGMGGFIHGRGARDFDVYLWNVSPTSIDGEGPRLWDWRDPQFLRGLLH